MKFNSTRTRLLILFFLSVGIIKGQPFKVKIKNESGGTAVVNITEGHIKWIARGNKIDSGDAPYTIEVAPGTKIVMTYGPEGSEVTRQIIFGSKTGSPDKPALLTLPKKARFSLVYLGKPEVSKDLTIESKIGEVTSK